MAKGKWRSASFGGGGVNTYSLKSSVALAQFFRDSRRDSHTGSHTNSLANIIESHRIYAFSVARFTSAVRYA
ncbi:hypothetical protein [uncultured Helicobacter sp.]|uniref:hypothetical protein n=1 Tax=uncultured Helicobacter sp. TaxID=175537 RepID=UPI00375055F9